MSDSIEQLSFELTSRALAEQERYLASLRSGASTVLGAASSILATRIGSRSSNAWAVVALIAYVFCFASAIWVLLPREMAAALSGSELMADADGNRADISNAYKAALRWSEPCIMRNRRPIDQLADSLTFGCVLIAVEIVSCVVSLTS